jgi:hypothetical protein
VIKRLVVLALLVGGTLTACGKDDQLPASSGDPTTSTTEGSTTTTAPPAEASLTATEYAYAGSNLTFAPGALSVTLKNDGKEEHQATIVRFKDGKTIADLGAVAAADPGKLDTVIDVFGGPNGVAPGGSTVTSTQTLEAGDYFFMCFIPAADGQPHAAKGMVAPFKIEGEAGSDAETAENTLSLKEYGFGTDEGSIPAGDYTITNDGEQLHEMAVYEPAEGKTAQDVMDYFEQQSPTGPPPVDPSGGIGPVNPGSSVNTELAAGDYVFICFLPDKADGAPHFTKGMIAAVTVE